MNSKIFTSVLRPSVVLAGLAMAVAATSAHATQFVTNGSFETNGGTGQVTFNTTLNGWSVPNQPGSYVFLFAPGTADTTEASSTFGLNDVGLWGPGNGVNNGLTPTSPDGGYFLAQDGAFQNSGGPITQTLTGLIAGNSYTVSFEYAGAQQQGFRGATTEGWIVDLGGAAAQSTIILNNADQGFTGWQSVSMTFTADGTSDVLSFLAVGTPSSTQPPFSLLDGVSVTETPEPGSLALLATGLCGVGGMLRKRFVKA
jgi:PEP-CTERM motif